MTKKPIYILLISLALLTGCNNTPSDVGAGLITDQQFGISSLDTLTVHTSTLKLDSLATSNYGGCTSCRMLVGYHDDEKLGPTQSQVAFQVHSPGTALSPITATYEALTLHLIRDSYYYYDTTQEMTLSVYQITKEMQNFSGSLYNVDKFQIDNTAPPLGTLTFLPRPHLKDSVEIPLSDDLGRKLLSMLQQQDVNITTANFPKYFFGLAIIPDSLHSRTMLGFKASPVMRLYYKDNSTAPGNIPDKYISFNVTTSEFFYNKISSNRTATKLSSLTTSTDLISSSLTDNEIYLQGGTGIAMRIDVPYAKNLSFLQTDLQISKALLTMTPIRSSSDPQNPLPNTITFDVINSVNQIVSPSYGSAALSTDELGYQVYNADITSFINTQILTTTTNVGNGLQVRLSSTDWTNTVNRLYLGDQRNYFFMKLKVYYITLTDQ